MTATVTLYERTEALRVVDEWIAEHEEEILAAGGDLDALPELRELLDKAEGDFKEKVERVALKVRELLATAEAVEVEVERLEGRARAMNNAAKSLKEYLKRNMEMAGVTKVNGLLATVAVQSSPPSVRCTLTPEQLAELRDTEYSYLVNVVPATHKLDARSAVELWKLGKGYMPPGVEVTQGSHIRIR